MIYLELFWNFLKVGLFTFGGGYASISIIRDIVLSTGWISPETFSDIVAVAESTPGPLMINIGTYVGSIKGGILGSAIATFATALPAFVIIVCISKVLKKFIKNPYVSAVMDGIKPAVIGIVLATGLSMFLENTGVLPSFSPDIKALGIALILVGLMMIFKKIFKKDLSVLLTIGISAVLGAIVYSL